MTIPVVHAVMKCTIEISVRSSSHAESFGDMLNAATREAEGILRNKLALIPEIKSISKVEFSHAVIKPAH